MGFYMWLSAVYKSLPLPSFENVATHRDFVCPATLCFRGEAKVCGVFFKWAIKKRIEVHVWADWGWGLKMTPVGGKKMHKWS